MSSAEDIRRRLERIPMGRSGNGGGNGEPPMGDIEARVAHLESDVGEIKLTLARMEGRFDAIDAKFDAIDTKFGAINTKLDALNARFDTELGALNARFDAVVTWKAAFVGLAVLLTGLAGIAWWVVQQILTPLLQAAGAA